MVRSINRTRIFLILAGVAVAVLIAWPTQRVDKAIGNRLAIQKINTNKVSLLKSLPDILSYCKKTAKAIQSLEGK